jgi:hypothetical protein
MGRVRNLESGIHPLSASDKTVCVDRRTHKCAASGWNETITFGSKSGVMQQF